ncbi:UDP-n-acteylglucosamine pyrophosphorylase [Salpingoeca rosetta]|uniref:UDP-N-acetylglucosamine diphosphorylase n=1 Tax=Salpingoeca rosetta (strain ATCC 50818 / BSB-021) TaxID=946362 RepID=F2U4W1_SALR5|nr:UDP-n-acteylglucosamine pyrophosphorylase [Salpingoeca rosetta]EGD82677.1 UDP-n-acteylglucosamine pyrophosphorylase [Salpingoeca rosetta]|eukprot:XP_004995913.1 UDP-n-acteylglucosamine pyrophosphorylase [Salpingoeca rosetta]
MSEQLRTKLTEHGQGHVLKFFDDLDDAAKAAFEKDLLSIDMDALNTQFQAAMSGSTTEKLDEFMKPLPASDIGNATAFPPTAEMNEWFDAGLKAISEGKVAALLLAGGQGSRLGSKDPKGMFPLGLPSGKTLLQLQAERILRLQQLAKDKFGVDCVIPWYVMTSGATMEKTANFFKSNDYFGVKESDVFIFSQFQVPSLTKDGKLILNGKGSIARNPDGNGGLYKALKERGALDDMARRGIEHVHVYCVDNVLVKVANPTFIGFCIAQGVEAGALVVPKAQPHEKVGVLCRVKDKYQVVEYSEISAATAEARDADGNLLYSAGNICNHYFSKAFLDVCGARHEELVHHIAHKKIPHLDDHGTLVKPDANNGVKMEKFVFDVFQFADRLGVLEVSREHSFSPLKNASGAASGTKETCQRDLYALHRLFLNAAGVRFQNKDGSELPLAKMDSRHVCEISPLVSYAGEGLEDYAAKHPTISEFPVHIQ